MNKLDKTYNKLNIELIKLEINQTRQNIEIKNYKTKEIAKIYFFIYNQYT